MENEQPPATPSAPSVQPGEPENPLPKPPDSLIYREKKEDIDNYVTEELTAMTKTRLRLLFVWFILLVVGSGWGMKEYWVPVSKLNTVQPQIDSLSNNLNTITSFLSKLAVADSATKKEIEKTAPSPSKGTNQDQTPYETNLMIIVVCAGILGGTTHGLSSLMNFRGERRLFKSWTLWYVSLPILGGILSLLVYILVCAGFLSESGGNNGLTTYSTAAIGILTGIATDKATKKLQALTGTMFATTDQDTREGELDPNNNSTSTLQTTKP